MPIQRLNGLSDEVVRRDSGKVSREEPGFSLRHHRLASREERDVEIYCSPLTSHSAIAAGTTLPFPLLI
jgi:hypothetical protein